MQKQHAMKFILNQCKSNIDISYLMSFEQKNVLKPLILFILKNMP